MKAIDFVPRRSVMARSAGGRLAFAASLLIALWIVIVWAVSLP